MPLQLDSTKAALEAALGQVIHGVKESCAEEIQQLKTQLEERQQDIEALKEENRSLRAAVTTCLSQCGQQHLPMSCASCGSKEHKMVGCLKVPYGRLAGCILCNNLDHDTDECMVFTNMPLKDQVEIVVYRRGSLPALKTKESWAEWFRKWNRHCKAHDPKLLKLPGRFPWTGAFTVDLASRNGGHDCDELQKEYDQHKDTGRLPRDPTYRDEYVGDFDVWAALLSGYTFG